MSQRPEIFDVWWEPFPGVTPVRGSISRAQYNRAMDRFGGAPATALDHASNRKSAMVRAVIPEAFRFCDALDRGEWFEQAADYDTAIRPPLWWEGRLWDTVCKSSIDELTSNLVQARAVNTGMRFINARRQAAIDAGREYGFDGSAVDVWQDDNYSAPIWDAIAGALSGGSVGGIPGAIIGGAAGWATANPYTPTGATPPQSSSLPASIRQMGREQRIEVATAVMHAVEQRAVIVDRDRVWRIILTALEV